MTLPLRRVLVVEDTEFVHQLYRSALRRIGGFELVHTFDGVQGLAALEAGPSFDLVLLDVEMPQMDGFTLLRQAVQRRLLGHARVLVVSGDHGRADEAIRAGAHGFMAKPFTLQQFTDTLERLHPRAPAAVDARHSG